MIGIAAPRGWLWPGFPATVLAMLLFASALRARAAEPEPPSKDFLEYLGTIEAKDDDWTIFDSKRPHTDQRDPPHPPKKTEKAPTTPQPGNEP